MHEHKWFVVINFCNLRSFLSAWYSTRCYVLVSVCELCSFGGKNRHFYLWTHAHTQIISKDGIRYASKKPSEGQARAKFNFQAQSSIELSLHKGELVVLTRRVDDNWFEGRIANRKGIFPVVYVEVSMNLIKLIQKKLSRKKLPKKHVNTLIKHRMVLHFANWNKQTSKQTKFVVIILNVLRMLFFFFIYLLRGGFGGKKVLTDIGSDVPAVPSKPIGSPAAHSLITSPNYQLSSPRSNYATTDVTTTSNIISNGNHSPVVRETSKSLQKSTEVLHVDTTNSEPIP